LFQIIIGHAPAPPVRKVFRKFVEHLTTPVIMSLQNRRPSGSSSDDSEDDLPPQQVDLAADEEWEDAEPDEESLTAVSLFSDKRFTGVDAVKQVILHDASEHSFDLREIVNRLGGYAHC